MVSILPTTPKAQHHVLPITSKGHLNDSQWNYSKRKHPCVSLNYWSSFHFPFSLGFIFFCFFQALQWKTLCSSSLSSSMLVSVIYVQQGYIKKKKKKFCQLHHAVAMICLPRRPDNVVTSRRLNSYSYRTVCWSGPERPSVMVHLELFPPGNL